MYDLAPLVKQRDPEIYGEGQKDAKARMTRVGQQYTADWKKELADAGLVYQVTVGGISAGGAEALITGGGAGTTIDSDQPELAVGVPAGFVLIPLEWRFSGRVDLDADAETGNVLLFVDNTQNIPVPIAANCTIETPTNHLDGGPAFPGYAESVETVDITDPICSDILSFKTIRASETTGAGQLVADLTDVWEAKSPMVIDGPCSIIGCWGGTAAVAGAAKLVFACVPRGRYYTN